MYYNVVQIGEKLSWLRKESRLTQLEVHQLTGISQQNISKYETGICKPSEKNLVLLANLYKTTTEDITTIPVAPPRTFESTLTLIESLLKLGVVKNLEDDIQKNEEVSKMVLNAIIQDVRTLKIKHHK